MASLGDINLPEYVPPPTKGPPTKPHVPSLVTAPEGEVVTFPDHSGIRVISPYFILLYPSCDPVPCMRSSIPYMTPSLNCPNGVPSSTVSDRILYSVRARVWFSLPEILILSDLTTAIFQVADILVSFCAKTTVLGSSIETANKIKIIFFIRLLPPVSVFFTFLYYINMMSHICTDYHLVSHLIKNSNLLSNSRKPLPLRGADASTAPSRGTANPFPLISQMIYFTSLTFVVSAIILFSSFSIYGDNIFGPGCSSLYSNNLRNTIYAFAYFPQPYCGYQTK